MQLVHHTLKHFKFAMLNIAFPFEMGNKGALLCLMRIVVANLNQGIDYKIKGINIVVLKD